MARISKSQFTKLEIIQVATRMFLERGYTNTTTKAISDELEMSKGNLTFHFPSKEHLLVVLVDMLCDFQWKLMNAEVGEGVSLVMAICLEMMSMASACEENEVAKDFFVADAYRSVTGADVAIANGGGIRAEIEVGDVTRKMLMDVNAFNNDICVLEVTGQQLIDVLEHGARECPDPIGGFFQVSGVEFEIHAYRETPVVTDQLDNFIEMDETKELRVQNVLVGGEPVELDKTYTLAGSAYVLTQGGDGLTMLDDANVIQQEGLPCDSEMFIKYFTENLNGVISAEKYGDIDGDGRIKIIKSDPDAYEFDYEIELDETITVSAPNYDSGEFVYIKFVPETDGRFILESDAGKDIDLDCLLYDANGEWIADSYDVNGMDFELIGYFEAGETYYFDAHNCFSESGAFKVDLNRLTHTADDGTVHTDLEFVEGTDSNCTEHGYTEGLYCSICEEFVSGHDEIELDEYYHIDDDYDDICDLCGESLIYVCEHICHSDNCFLSFIWTVVNFFFKLIDVQQYCDCGELHY